MRAVTLRTRAPSRFPTATSPGMWGRVWLRAKVPLFATENEPPPYGRPYEVPPKSPARTVTSPSGVVKATLESPWSSYLK